MKNIKNQIQNLSNEKLDTSQESISSEWQLHNNRLNFLQQTLTKIQKKITKFEKNISFLSDASNQFKQQFRQKLNQIISIVSQPQHLEQNLLTLQDLNQVKHQIVKLQEELRKNSHQISKFQHQITQLTQMSCFSFNANQIQDYVIDKMAILEQKNKKFINEKIIEIQKTLHEIQKNAQNQKIHTSQLSNRTNVNNNFLNTSTFSKASSQNCLSNSRSQSKLANSRSSNLFECTATIRQNTALKKLNFNEDDHFSPSIQPLSSVQNASIKSNASTNNHASGVPTSQNNSRVVYLRQKLKQFEEINKKYQKKQVEYDKKKKQICSQNQRNRLVKNPSLKACKHQVQVQCEQDNNTFHVSKRLNEAHKQTQLTAHQRYDSSNKKYTNSSVTTSLARHQSSAKKIDKLKSIKDYLEQTESEIQDSFLEPNYRHLN